MRLWSLHPSYLDSSGLVALWREGLLARKVLSGQTKGYIHHPQLQRFRETPHPLQTLDAYLKAVHDESLPTPFILPHPLFQVGPGERCPWEKLR